uniref:Uncharacterized protein n=1 Tax=uncultured bacterium CSLC3 TaxID=1091572 RepID=G4WVU8_9BACT|nr:hypothetical protein [uncultured bacterium CSLC3]
MGLHRRFSTASALGDSIDYFLNHILTRSWEPRWRGQNSSLVRDQLVHLDFVTLCCQEKLIMNDDKRLFKHYSIGAPADTQNGGAAGICRPGQASCHPHAVARFDLSAFSTTTRADSTCLRPGRRLRQMNYHRQDGGHEVSEICPRAPLPQCTVIHAAKIAYR